MSQGVVGLRAVADAIWCGAMHMGDITDDTWDEAWEGLASGHAHNHGYTEAGTGASTWDFADHHPDHHVWDAALGVVGGPATSGPGPVDSAISWADAQNAHTRAVWLAVEDGVVATAQDGLWPDDATWVVVWAAAKDAALDAAMPRTNEEPR